MKSFIFLLIVLLTSAAYPQTPNWTAVKETNINYGSALSFDVFTNSYGNHIIIQENNALKYYKMNINGVAGSPVTLESTSVVSPSISGDATRLYVVYRKSTENYIRTKYSSNGGASWSYIANLTNPSGSANSIESVFSNDRLHVAYQISNSTYYSMYREGQGWTSPYTVSNTEAGTAPRIAAWKDADEDKVYFIYRNSNTTGKFREYNVATNQWGNIYSGYSLNPSNLSTSAPTGFTVGNDRIYYYYSYTTSSPYMTYFQYRILTKIGGVISESYPEPNETFKVYTATTFDGISYTAFWFNFFIDGEYEPGLYRAKNLGTQFYSFDQIYWNNYQEAVYFPPVNISSAGYETHIIWKDNLGNNNGNNLRYIYDDQNPIAPQYLQVMPDANYHPYLTWNSNPEPDMNHYVVEKAYNGGWIPLTQTTNTFYEDPNEYYCNVPPPYHCPYGHNVYYRVRAVDNNSHQSDPSNEAIANVQGGGIEKTIAQNPEQAVPKEYYLDQNYPNPFNPTTNVSYQIKEMGFVSLKVYDMLGREVAELVNENQSEGYYSVVFNASNLSSGIYFYQIKSGSFSDIKKMLLVK